jgi:hypothetical protein
VNTRRMALCKIGGFALSAIFVVLLWYWRVLQTGLFLLFAALKIRDRDSNGFAVAITWGDLSATGTSSIALNPRVSITYHPEYHHYDPQMADRSLAAIAQLGAGWLRTDVRWRALLPDGVNIDPRAVAWYRNFFVAARSRGLRLVIVLSSPPQQVLNRESTNARLEDWNHFVEIAAQELDVGDGIYQLMNEPNNPVYRFFDSQDAGIAISGAASIIRSRNRAARIAINVTLDLWGWKEYLEGLLRSSGDSIDIIGMDHYPGTWTVGRKDRWEQVFKLARLAGAASGDALWSRHQVAIMESGFSTNAPTRNERRQIEYFEQLSTVAEQLRKLQPTADALLGCYELCDRDSSAWLDPEAHFGLLTQDLKPKLAFSALSSLIRSV